MAGNWCYLSENVVENRTNLYTVKTDSQKKTKKKKKKQSSDNPSEEPKSKSPEGKPDSTI